MFDLSEEFSGKFYCKRDFSLVIHNSFYQVHTYLFECFLQANHTITKLTDERSMATKEKDMLKHEVVSNLFSASFSIILATHLD